MADLLRGAIHIAAGAAANERAKQSAEQVKDTLIEITSASYDKATAYVSIVIFGAYASFFALWGLTRDLLPPRSVGMTAFLMGVSVLTFVLFEVFKMIVVSRHLMIVSRLVAQELPPDEFLEAHDAANRKARLFTLKTVLPIWALSLVISLGTGLPAAAILLWYFVRVAWAGTLNG